MMTRTVTPITVVLSLVSLLLLPPQDARAGAAGCRCVGGMVNKYVWKWVWDWVWDPCAYRTSECRGGSRFNPATGMTEFEPCAYMESVCQGGDVHKYVYKYVFDFVFDSCARWVCD